MATFYDHFRECAGQWPGNVALEIQRQDQVESYTYAEVQRGAESIGRWLVDNGLKPGERIAILADNHPRWVMAYLGIIAAGCTTVPLDTALHAEQIGKLLTDSGSSVLFCGSKYLGTAGAAVGQLAMKTVLTDGDAGEGAVRLRSGQVRATPAAELRSAGTGETPVPTRAVLNRA